MKPQIGFTLTELLVVLVILAGTGGWVANVIKLMATLSDPLTGSFILRCVGVLFFPIGAVMGFL
jgi:prepilin-type N-terminal cleavage/methylation domain-containing protein